MNTAILVSLSLCVAVGVNKQATKPNIVFIIADDLGWNDVSFHGSNQFLTPNIDALAYSGVILKDYYTQPICTPARAALLTGRHPIHNGMEHDVLYAPEPWGLPLTEKILPEYLKPLGYTTRAIGKWHLGFFKSDYTPSRRGFDTHYGNWLGELDHFTHYGSLPRPGYDFRRELNLTWEDVGKYAADVFTKEADRIINNHDVNKPLFLYVAHVAPHAPLQAPQPVIDRFQYIPEKKRRTFAAMVTKVDESVGRITKALKENNMLNNSIIILVSDNGGATNGFNGNVASNFPLRGCKDTLWEGGVRGVGLIWSPLLKGPPRVHRGLFNVQDWLPTLLSAVDPTILLNNSILERNLDGVSQWNALDGDSPPPYNTMLHNIDPVREIAALRHNDWKIVTGRTYNGRYDGFYGRLSGEVPYDVNTIRTSHSGRAVQSTTRPLPDTITLHKLRADSLIYCKMVEVKISANANVTINLFVDLIENSACDTSASNINKWTSIAAQNFTRPDQDTCQPHVSPCLFNIANDPCEKDNLAESNPIVVQQLLSMIEAYHLTPPNNKPEDPKSYPVNWNNTWVSWRDYV